MSHAWCSLLQALELVKLSAEIDFLPRAVVGLAVQLPGASESSEVFPLICKYVEIAACFVISADF